MLRIIIALLIAIFIFNSSQETTINYNEIIKNQKMFLVKNIRGVLPTLSGNLRDLYSSFFSYYKKEVGKLFIFKIIILINQKFLITTHSSSINPFFSCKTCIVSLTLHMNGKIIRIILTLKKLSQLRTNQNRQHNK